MHQARLLTFFLVASCHVVFASPKPTGELTPQQIAAKVLPSVVRISTFDATGSPIASGSGVVIARNRIATCWHVIHDASKITVTFTTGDSEQYGGSYLVDANDDLAIISADTQHVRPVKIGLVPPLGADVVAIGNPEGYDGTISTGVVSGVRTINGVRFVQTTAPISPGSSGGALLDGEGRLIGITSMYNRAGQNLNFAIIADYAKVLSSNRSRVSGWFIRSRADATILIDPQARDMNTKVQLTHHFITLWSPVDPNAKLDFAQIETDIGMGVDVNTRDGDGCTVLMAAASCGDTYFVQELLKLGADPNIVDDKAETALIRASVLGHDDVVNILMSTPRH